MFIMKILKRNDVRNRDVYMCVYKYQWQREKTFVQRLLATE